MPRDIAQVTLVGLLQPSAALVQPIQRFRSEPRESGFRDPRVRSPRVHHVGLIVTGPICASAFEATEPWRDSGANCAEDPTLSDLGGDARAAGRLRYRGVAINRRTETGVVKGPDPRHRRHAVPAPAFASRLDHETKGLANGYDPD